jgi:hypothetical protein
MQYQGCTGLAGTEPHAQGVGLGGYSTYVGLNGHKVGIVVAVAEGGDRGEVREYTLDVGRARGEGVYSSR